MKSPSLAGVALVALILAALVSVFLPDKTHTDGAARFYIPPLMSQSRS